MLTIECACYFEGLPVCGNREISRTEVWRRDKITNSFHLPFRVLMTINLPSFNHKTKCLLDHVGKCGLFWLFVCINIISAVLHLLCWPKFNLSGGFTEHKSVKILSMQVIFRIGEHYAHLLPSRSWGQSPWPSHRVLLMLSQSRPFLKPWRSFWSVKGIFLWTSDSFNI